MPNPEGLLVTPTRLAFRRLEDVPPPCGTSSFFSRINNRAVDETRASDERKRIVRLLIAPFSPAVAVAAAAFVIVIVFVIMIMFVFVGRRRGQGSR